MARLPKNPKERADNHKVSASACMGETRKLELSEMTSGGTESPQLEAAPYAPLSLREPEAAWESRQSA